MVQPTRPLTIMPPRTRSTASINRNGINTNSHLHNEGATQSHPPSPPLQSLSGRSPSSSSGDESDTPSSIFDPPDRQSTVSSALTTPPPRHPPFDLTAWLAASRARYHAEMDAWRQRFHHYTRLANWIYVIEAIILATVLAWILRGRPSHLDWTLDTTIPEFHITNDAALLCHSRDCGYNAGFIPLRDPASNPPTPLSSSMTGGISRSRRSNSGDGVGNIGIPTLRYGNAALGAIGHVHLQICLDDDPSIMEKWWPTHLCNRTELFTLNPVAYIPAAKANRISFALLTREEREARRDRSLPLTVWRDNGEGGVVVRGMAFQLGSEVGIGFARAFGYI